MNNEAKNQGAMVFASAFAETLSASLVEATGSSWPIEVIKSGPVPTIDAAPIQFRLTVDGALSGECFFEFYEPQVADVLAQMTKQPLKELGDQHKETFAKFISSMTQGLSNSSLAKYGALNIKVEPVTGLAFGGMFVVPVAAAKGQPELQVLLYFGNQLLDALSSACDTASEGGDREPASPYNLKLVMDVELNVSLRFGQRQLPLRDVLDLASGSIVELDRMVDEPVELFLDGKLIARGEAVVVDGNYGLRVTEIPQPLTSHFLN